LVDYSKWDHIEVSDDEGEDCHPNIDKNSWIKWKKEAKERKKQIEEEERKKAEQDHLKRVDTIKEVETQIKEKEGQENQEKEVQALKKQLEDLRKKDEEYLAKKKKEEEFNKKHPVWDEKSICRDSYSKTIINKPVDPLEELKKEVPKSKETAPKETAETAPKEAPKETKKENAANGSFKEKTNETEEKEMTEEEKRKAEEEQALVDEYVKQMEIKAHKFAAAKDYDQYFDAIKQHPEIICTETHQYLLLHTSDFIKNGHDEISKRYLKAACIVNYCLELGGDGVSLFFARMRDPNPRWRMEFEKDHISYWHRIREKLDEMGKIKKKNSTEAKSTPDSNSEDVPIEDVDN